MNSPLSPDALEAHLRHIGAERYHRNHPLHKAMYNGQLTKGQLQAWALNRYYYQSQIPIKDAYILAKLPSSALRREWRHRLEDHDGSDISGGGIARWLKLTEGLGLDTSYVTSLKGILPSTRFAVDAYVTFVRERSPLAAIASSLTELFSPTIIGERTEGMLRNYAFISEDTLAYFTPRLTQAPRDSLFALAYVKEHAVTVAQQHDVINALKFKCDILWTLLDALDYAYVQGHPPPGVFIPEHHDNTSRT